MEQPHLSTQLDYLEQKYQDALGKIAKLQQRTESQDYTLQEQAHKIKELEEALTRANNQLARLPQLDEQLETFKEELIHFVERRTSRYQPPAPESGGNLMQQQLDNHTKAINELRREVDKTQRFDEQISLARTEATRLNKDVSQFQTNLDKVRKQLEEQGRPFNFLEEQHRATARQLTEVQAALPELHKKIESAQTKVQLVDQKIPQFAKYEAALDSMRDEIRRHREHMDFQVAQRERQLKNWTELAEATERRLAKNETLVEKYAEHYQLNKRALASLQDFQERLQRDQHHFGELQRLAEERQRTELEKFQADFAQRWKKQSMELQPQFIDFQKSIEALQTGIDDLTRLNQALEEQLSMLLQIIEEDVQARAVAITDWQQRFEAIANGQG